MKVRGMVYRCEICGAEISVLAPRIGRFEPVCCNEPMAPQEKRLTFYRCGECGAEIAVLRQGTGEFAPRCCNLAMEPIPT